MGSVWVAEQVDLGSHVAVKFIAAKKSRDPDTVARFNREAASAAGIDNPHVVQILEHGTTGDGTPFLVMELLDGETLGERLARLGTVSLQEAKEVLSQVGEALDAAHGLGIVHRDIKPDNLFLTAREFGLVKVFDFGAAKQWQDQNDALTRTGVVVGTPEYMSPEQVLGTRDVDYRSDLWALAAVVYRMIVGSVPFTADTPHALFFSICKGEFEPLAGTTAPLELEPWFRRAFTQAKDKRFASADEMSRSFERALVEFSVPEWPRAEMRSGLDWDDATELLQGDALKAQLAARAQADVEPVTRRPGQVQPSDDSTPGSRDLLGSTLDMVAPPTVDDRAPTQEVSPERAAELLSGALAQRSPLDDPGDPLGEPSPEPAHVEPGLRTAAEAAPSEPGIVADRDSSQALEEMLAQALAPIATPSAPGVTSAAAFPAAESSPGLAPPGEPSPREWPMAPAPEPSASRFAAVAGNGPAQAAPTATPTGGRGDPTSPRAGQVVLLVGLIVVTLAVAAFGLWRIGLFGERLGEEPTADGEPTTSASVVSPEPVVSADAPAATVDSAEAGAGGSAEEGKIGYLTVICSPACSQVWLGDQPLGRSPLKRHEVPIGAHSLSLMGPNLKQKMLTIEIAPGEHVVKRTLMQETTPAGPATGAAPPPDDKAPESPPGGEGTSAPTTTKPKAPEVDDKMGF